MSSTVSSLIDFDLGISATLLGLSTITRMFGGNKTTIGHAKDVKENAED